MTKCKCIEPRSGMIINLSRLIKPKTSYIICPGPGREHRIPVKLKWEGQMALTPAKFWRTEGEKIRCYLCPHNCMIGEGKIGMCLVRTNRQGSLFTKNYGQVTSYGMDPVEKKPLYHFYPGSKIFSMGTWGCNLKCLFCQNWEISQQEAPADHFEPKEAVDMAVNEGSSMIAYTYNEPFIWYEFVYDTAVEAGGRGLKNVLVTNGFVSEEPLKEILPHIDAMNIDLKSFNDDFYKKTCSGRLDPVLRTIETVYRAGVHVELTTLVIPTLNDGEDISRVIDWVASISPDIPLHFSRYFPQYKMKLPPTGVDTLLNAYRLAQKKLKYVYVGNVPLEVSGADTICPKCKSSIIERSGYFTQVKGLKGNKCAECGEVIYGKF
jgi:pyruvate formate lyase activating enzyme